MRSFGYLRDRLFIGCCLLYASNRWLLKPRLHNAFIQGHFNDLLLIPCALPPLLLLQRWLRLRPDDQPPKPGEIFFHLVLWSILFEWIGPHIVAHAVGDPWDVLAYFAGGIVAALWWWRDALKRTPAAA